MCRTGVFLDLVSIVLCHSWKTIDLCRNPVLMKN